MADPFSTIAGVAGLVDILTRMSYQVSRLITEWKDAPQQIHFLSEEVRISRNVTRQLKDLCNTLREHNLTEAHDCANATVAQLSRAKPVWEELEDILRSARCFTTSKIREDLWMNKSNRIATLQGRLQEIRFCTMEVLGIHSITQSLNIRSAVASYHSDTFAMYQAVATSLSDIQFKLGEVEARTNKHDYLCRGHGRAAAGPPNYLTSQKTLQFKPTCNSCCLCRCHLHNRKRRVPIVPWAPLMGAFVVVYSGWTLLGQQCDVAQCSYAKVSEVEAKYSLPSWWSLNISISVTFRILYGLPTAVLTVRRRIPTGSDSKYQSIIGFSKLGKCAEIRGLLGRRPDAVLDVSSRQGATALEFALRYHQIDAARVLVAAGADPLAENDLGIPAFFYGLSFRHHRNNSLQQEFETLLPSSSFYDEYGFSHLHKVVLGIRPSDLEAQLDDVSCSHLNQQDIIGLTPLHWAASQRDTSAVRILLKAGADPNIVDKEGYTPLHWAVRAGSRSCAEDLIRAGADLNKRHVRGYTTMHEAAMTMNGVEILEFLLSYKIGINDSQNASKSSPLALATMYGRVNNCKLLLQHGAQIDLPDWEGDTPVLETIGNPRGAECLSLLLSRGCNYLHLNFQGQSILHYMALRGSAEEAKALAASKLKGLDPDARDKHNKTAQQYFEARAGITEDQQAAFNELIKSIERANATTAVKNDVYDGEEDDLFFDALES